MASADDWELFGPSLGGMDGGSEAQALLAVIAADDEPIIPQSQAVDDDEPGVPQTQPGIQLFAGNEGGDSDAEGANFIGGSNGVGLPGVGSSARGSGPEEGSSRRRKLEKSFDAEWVGPRALPGVSGAAVDSPGGNRLDFADPHSSCGGTDVKKRKVGLSQRVWEALAHEWVSQQRHNGIEGSYRDARKAFRINSMSDTDVVVLVDAWLEKHGDVGPDGLAAEIRASRNVMLARMAVPVDPDGKRVRVKPFMTGQWAMVTYNCAAWVIPAADVGRPTSVDEAVVAVRANPKAMAIWSAVQARIQEFVGTVGVLKYSYCMEVSTSSIGQEHLRVHVHACLEANGWFSIGKATQLAIGEAVPFVSGRRNNRGRQTDQWGRIGTAASAHYYCLVEKIGQVICCTS